MAEFLGIPYANPELGVGRQTLESQRRKVELAAEEEKRRKLAEDFEKRKKEESIASKMGLSPDERARYLGANVPGVELEPTKQPEGTGQTAKVATPAQVPVGGEGTKPSKEQPKTTLGESQGKLQAAVDKVAKGSGKNVPKDKLEALTESLDEVEKSVPTSDPARSDLLQLRAEAYKLYKEKADRNEWMDVAERALNAIGQIASARSATGQQVGGLPLSRTDYGARTEQALREYQSELGLAGEKVRGEEREADRQAAAREREIGRRRGTIEEKIKTERQARAEAGDTERARIAAASRENIAGARAAQPRVSIQELKGIDSEIKATTAAIGAANKFAAAGDEKSAKAALGGFLTATGLTPEEVDAEVKNRSAGIFTGPSKKEARQQYASERVQELRDKLEQLKGDRVSLVGGQAAAQPAAAESAPVAPTTAASPAGQAAPASDMVIAQIPGNEPMKMSREQAAKAKQKYPNLVITPVR